MSDDLPKAIWSGSFMLGGVEVKCHVLDNGQRIINAESVDEIFSNLGEVHPDEIYEFARFVSGKGIPDA